MSEFRFPELGDKYCENRSHAYNSYISSVNWSERIVNEGIQENSRKWLLNDLSEFLSEEYGISNAMPNHQSMWKALELMDGYEKDIPQPVIGQEPVIYDKSEEQREIVFKKLVLQAERKGYLENFRLAEPWHPQPFLSGDFVSYPYQHNTAILYRGVSRDHFYRGGDRPEKKSHGSYKRHPESTLELGHWNPGNSWNEDGKDAVWTSAFLKMSADNYTYEIDKKDGVVIEFQVPTEMIQIGAHNYPKFHNLEELRERFDSPEEFREYMLDKKEKYTEAISFLVRPKIPLEYVTGVWDLEVYDEPHFLPLQSESERDAVDIMHNLQPDQIPSNARFAEASNNQESVSRVKELEEIEENYLEKGGRFHSLKRSLEKAFYELETLVSYLRQIMEQTNSMPKPGRWGRSFGFTLDSLISTLKDFNRQVERARKNLEEIQSIEVQTEQSEVTDLNELHQVVAKNYSLLKNNKDCIEKLSENIEEKKSDITRVKKDIVRKGKVEEKDKKLIHRCTTIGADCVVKLVETLEDVKFSEEELKKNIGESNVRIRSKARKIKNELKSGRIAIKNLEKLRRRLEKAEEIANETATGDKITERGYEAIEELLENSHDAEKTGYNYILNKTSSIMKKSTPDTVPVENSEELVSKLESQKRTIIRAEQKLKVSKTSIDEKISEIEGLMDELRSKDDHSYDKTIAEEVDEMSEPPEFVVTRKAIQNLKMINLRNNIIKRSKAA